MKKTLAIVLFVFASSQVVKAQFIKEKAIDVSIGYGLSAPYDDVDVTGSGFYLQGEYVLTAAKWFDIRPYAGLVMAKTKTGGERQGNPEYKSNTNAFLIGGKIRVTAPIPWVAPYIESGVGASIGSFETFTPFTNLEEKGVVLHIPVSLGLELGPKHNVSVGFTYYFHPSVEQFAGAAAFGITIPLRG